MPLIRSLVVLQRFDITDGHVDLLTRQDVRDRLSEDIRALLMQQRGRLAPRPGRVVSSLRFLAPHDLSLYGALADLDRHIIDRSSLRQRKRIDRFNLVRKWILKLLRDGNASQKCADLSFDVGMLQRTGSRRNTISADCEQLAFGRCSLGQRLMRS